MSNNAIPKNNKVMLALGEDCFDGCVAAEDEVDLKMVRQGDLGGGPEGQIVVG